VVANQKIEDLKYEGGVGMCKADYAEKFKGGGKRETGNTGKMVSDVYKMAPGH